MRHVPVMQKTVILTGRDKWDNLSQLRVTGTDKRGVERDLREGTPGGRDAKKRARQRVQNRKGKRDPRSHAGDPRLYSGRDKDD